ncbi:MlaD family protein [Prosthecobacter sp.]|uniref:MlaD family protein n=1 Tax=Prosthecobacter sp. TaxID=1965333 RepID=UPI002ABB42A1|nr:MlaD family protein [Prosthecobacter sp.]MDZ4403450.1 MlaD family protein [Prosthecobacter sp.]
MSKNASPTLIGLFTLGGLVLAGTALVLLGAGKFFEKTTNVMLYFDKSADGLLVGSEVRFGGVRIGRVSSINVLVDPKENRKIIPILVELSTKQLAAVGATIGGGIDFTTDAGVQKAVSSGLRARMKQMSFVTGQMNIEFDIAPNVQGLIFEPTVKPPYPVVPTVGTELDALMLSISDGLKKLNNIDLTGLIKDLRDTLASAKTQVDALRMKEINDNLVGLTADMRALTGSHKLSAAIDNLDIALANLKELTAKANKGIDPMLTDMEKAVKQASAAFTQLETASADISKVANPRAPVLMRLQLVLEEAEHASRAIKELANDLKRNPNSLLLGKDSKP